MSTLKTDYKGDILDLTQNDKRCFETIQNQDGSVSFNDVTVYEQEGDNFGPSDMNATNEEVNRLAENLIANGVDFKFAYNGTDYGYTINGTFYPFRTRHTDTFSPTSRANNLDMGIFHTKRFVDTTAVPNANSATYTFPQNDTGATKDLGATNNYRYANAQNVYNKGITDGRVGYMVIPTATKSITANGNNQDVLNYSKVNVNVPNNPINWLILSGVNDYSRYTTRICDAYGNVTAGTSAGIYTLTYSGDGNSTITVKTSQAGTYYRVSSDVSAGIVTVPAGGTVISYTMSQHSAAQRFCFVYKLS